MKGDKKPEKEVLEHNPLFKRWKKGDIRVALVYPNAYVGGIANIGIQQIYAEVNSTENFVCERFYGDVFDCRRSVETGAYLKDFDIALFSVQFEEDMFKAAKIASELTNPVKIAGGPCVLENPLPLSPYFDYFYVGEIDGEVNRVLEVAMSGGEEGCLIKSRTAVEMSESGEKLRVRKAELNSHLKKEIIGSGVYGRCFLLEVGRGCKRSCSFCVVRQIYRPCRWRKLELLLDVARSADVNRIALISPSVTDHPNAKDLLSELVNMGFEVSPSSMRADTIDEELADLLVACGQKSITIAPEAGSEKLRRVLRKGIDEETVLSSAEIIRERGIKNVKMYYMIGIPGENKEDVNEILRLTEKVKKLGLKVSVSVNPLVPKPHTPLQFAPFGGMFEEFQKGFQRGKDFRSSGLAKEVLKVLKVLRERSKTLERGFRKIRVRFSIERGEEFAIQTIVSRGSVDVGRYLTLGKREVLRKFPHLLMELNFERQPWEFVDHGYSFKRLRTEYEKLMEIAGVCAV